MSLTSSKDSQPGVIPPSWGHSKVREEGKGRATCRLLGQQQEDSVLTNICEMNQCRAVGAKMKDSALPCPCMQSGKRTVITGTAGAREMSQRAGADVLRAEAPRFDLLHDL